MIEHRVAPRTVAHTRPRSQRPPVDMEVPRPVDAARAEGGAGAEDSGLGWDLETLVGKDLDELVQGKPPRPLHSQLGPAE
eukprot:8250674-Alexandrium_andersonii.AAC.1